MKYLLVTVILITAAFGTAFGQCSEADKKALEAFDRAWGEATRRGDRAALQNILADESVDMSPGEFLTKTQEIDNVVKQAERNKTNPESVDNVTHDHYIIVCTPNSATITHRNVTTRFASKEQPLYSRSVHFLEKRGGRWQVVSSAGHGLDDAGVLSYMELDWINAVKSRDYAWMEKNYASDFTEVSFMTGDINNKRQAIDIFKTDRTVFDSMMTEDLNIRVDGNIAIVTGIGHAKGKDGEGTPFDIKLRFTDTFIKRDGRWQAWASQATMLPKP